jgi:hypothetical protein
MGIEKILIYVFAAIITLYIAFTLISSFAAITPGSAIFGWIIFIVLFIAVILGIIGFFREFF